MNRSIPRVMPPSADMTAYMRAYRELVALQQHVPAPRGKKRNRVGAGAHGRRQRLPQIEQQEGHCPFCGLETERADCCIVCAHEISRGRM